MPTDYDRQFPDKQTWLEALKYLKKADLNKDGKLSVDEARKIVLGVTPDWEKQYNQAPCRADEQLIPAIAEGLQAAEQEARQRRYKAITQMLDSDLGKIVFPKGADPLPVDIVEPLVRLDVARVRKCGRQPLNARDA